MHMVIDELLTKEQLESPKRYIYEICEMYGWGYPDLVTEEVDGHTLTYLEMSESKAKRRERLIKDACIRLGIRSTSNIVEEADGRYSCYATIPFYSK